MKIKSRAPKLLISLCLILLAGGAAYGLAYKVRQNNAYVPPPQNAYVPNKPDEIKKDNVLINVPFTSQAPNANWNDPRQQDGCEEASVLMSWMWVSGKTYTKAEAEKEIIAISDFEKLQYGNFHDTDATDTVRFMKEYFGYDKALIVDNPDIEDIKNALRDNKIVIVPANGQKLGNPNFRNGGPYTHMLVIKGFDDSKKQFITNDPGTRLGEGYVYDYSVLYNAMVNYPSGQHLPQEGRPKAMIVIQK
jgi:hypothetical protein